MKRSFLCITFILAAMATFASGAKDKAQITVGILNGPSAIPCAHLMETEDMNFKTFAAANQLLPKLINGEVDIGFLPPNVAAKAYTANKGSIVCIGVSGLGMLSLITKDKNISTVADLEGKIIAVAGSGATPEYITRYILQKNNVNATLDFSIPNNEIAAALISGKVDYAIVPEPFATVACTKDTSVRRALNIQSEFEKVGGSASYPMTLIVARKEFVQQHPSLVKTFLSAYQKSFNWTQANQEQAGLAVERIGLGLTAALAQKAIPYANFTYKTPSQARQSIESLLSLFLQFAPESIGAALPTDGFSFK